MFRRATLLVLLFAMVFGIPLSAQAISYNYTPIDVPGSGGTIANGVNDAGEIVGVAGDHGFVMSGEIFTIFDVPGATVTHANGINNRGQIVGFFQLPSGGGQHAFLKDGSSITTFDFPGAMAGTTIANGINNAGQIVGSYISTITGAQTAFLKDGSILTTINVPGACSNCISGAADIANNGRIVGFFEDERPPTLPFRHGFLEDGASFTTIDYPGALSTNAFGINDRGWIVGEFGTTGPSSGFLKQGSTFLQIQPPDVWSNQANGINNAGEIVGFFNDFSGMTHGYLATPVPPAVPEPSTLLLLGSGLAGLGGIIWRRRPKTIPRPCMSTSARWPVPRCMTSTGLPAMMMGNGSSSIETGPTPRAARSETPAEAKDYIQEQTGGTVRQYQYPKRLRSTRPWQRSGCRSGCECRARWIE